MWRTLSAALALLTAAVLYFVNLVYRKRREFDDLVKLPLSDSQDVAVSWKLTSSAWSPH